MRYMKSANKQINFQIQDTGKNEQPSFKMARHAEMVLPEQRSKPQSFSLKPIPGMPIREKVLKQRDGDFVVLKPIPMETEVVQKKRYTEDVGQKRSMPTPVNKKNN